MLKLTGIIVLSLFLVTNVYSQETQDFKVRNVAIFVYDGVDLLDFAAPAEIFSNVVVHTPNRQKINAFNVYFVNLDKDMVKSKGFVSIFPNYTVFDCPKPDIVVIPGGNIEKMLENYKFNKWLKYSAPGCCSVVGIGTGSYALANTGLLNGGKVAVWEGAEEIFQKAFPAVEILETSDYVLSNNIYTTAGSAGSIELCLSIVERFYGSEAAENAAEYINYNFKTQNTGFLRSP